MTFAFEKLVQDGIWQLQTRPLKGKTDNVYTISVAQIAGDRSGSHKFTFTDPHYLAIAAGRQYHIHLDRNKPVPNLLTLQSTSSRRSALSEESSTTSRRSVRRVSRRPSPRRGRSSCAREHPQVPLVSTRRCRS